MILVYSTAREWVITTVTSTGEFRVSRLSRTTVSKDFIHLLILLWHALKGTGFPRLYTPMKAGRPKKKTKKNGMCTTDDKVNSSKPYSSVRPSLWFARVFGCPNGRITYVLQEQDLQKVSLGCLECSASVSFNHWWVLGDKAGSLSCLSSSPELAFLASWHLSLSSPDCLS